ncbi:DUF1349 domain-containing protein, partial [Pontibaca salina]
VIPGGNAPYLRVERTGDLWTFDYSQDGVSWTTAGSVSHNLAVTSAGVFAGNVGQANGYTARVDYVEFASDPIADEDGSFTPENQPPVAVDDAFDLLPDSVLTIDVAA